MEQKLFNLKDGLPTGPEVAEIMAMWPDLKPGDRISYADVAALIGVAHGSSRFAAVTKAWRKRMLAEQSIVIECEKNAAFYVPTDKQLTAATHGILSHIGRAAKKHRQKLATVKTQEHMATAAHHMRLLLTAEEGVKDSKKLLLQCQPAGNPRLPTPAADQQVAQH